MHTKIFKYEITNRSAPLQKVKPKSEPALELANVIDDHERIGVERINTNMDEHGTQEHRQYASVDCSSYLIIYAIYSRRGNTP